MYYRILNALWLYPQNFVQEFVDDYRFYVSYCAFGDEIST